MHSNSFSYRLKKDCWFLKLLQEEPTVCKKVLLLPTKRDYEALTVRERKEKKKERVQPDLSQLTQEKKRHYKISVSSVVLDTGRRQTFLLEKKAAAALAALAAYVSVLHMTSRWKSWLARMSFSRCSWVSATLPPLSAVTGMCIRSTNL